MFWPKIVYLVFVIVIFILFWVSFRFSKVAMEIDDIAKKDQKMKTFLWIVWCILWCTGCYFFGYLIGKVFFSILGDL